MEILSITKEDSGSYTVAYENNAITYLTTVFISDGELRCGRYCSSEKNGKPNVEVLESEIKKEILQLCLKHEFFRVRNVVNPFKLK